MKTLNLILLDDRIRMTFVLFERDKREGRMRILSLCLIIVFCQNAFIQEVKSETEQKLSTTSIAQKQKNSTNQNLQTSEDKYLTEKSQKVDLTNISEEEQLHQIKEGAILPQESFEGEIFDTTQNNQQVDMFYCTDYSNVKHMIIDIDDFQNISETKLKTFFALESLSVINFDSTKKRTIEYSKKLTILLTVASKLKYLRLCNVNLEKFPKEICNLKYLMELNIEDKRITAIPTDIEKLKNLKRLMIKCDKIKNLPEELGKLLNLAHLYLKCDCLTEIPLEIGNLTNLRYLNLHCRELKKLPKEIMDLTNQNLKYVNCVGSQIENFTIGDNARNLVIQTSTKSSFKSTLTNILNYIKWTFSNAWNSLKKRISGSSQER